MNVDHNKKPYVHWTEQLSAGLLQRRILLDALNTITRYWTVPLVVLVAAFSLGRSTPTALGARDQTIAVLVQRWDFDLMKWEIKALSQKGRTVFAQPAEDLTTEARIALVEQYIDRAQHIGQLEQAINRVLSQNGNQTTEQTETLQRELDDLRTTQQNLRPTVEQILQQQVAEELVAAGMGVGDGPVPPVFFTFTEPPKKLVVSPRDRIATIYSRMLKADMPLAQVETSEEAIRQEENLSAYITNTGGLGAYPAMVIDRASLPWIISTIAHEWTHNYLTLFPLGIRYNSSGELTTINETIADIVGDEIGERVVRRYYPAFAPAEPETDAGQPADQEEDNGPPAFDFRREMHKTRLHVDELLAAGQVQSAEAYMEARRLFFVAHGYPLRVLNQAYFAFHGSYGTSAASTSPIGPKLERLRALTGDLPAFLHTVRWFTSGDDIDQALARLQANQTDPDRSVHPVPNRPATGRMGIASQRQTMNAADRASVEQLQSQVQN